ncbi:hypothetical protein Tco_1534126 [Tanacetum coccineum]
MKKMSEKPGHVRPANGFYEKLNALMFVPQQELSREQAYWLPANERASQTSNPNSPVTPFVRKSRPPSQVLTSLRNVNAVFPQFEGIIKERTTQKPDYVSEWCFDYAKQFVEQQLLKLLEFGKLTHLVLVFLFSLSSYKELSKIARLVPGDVIKETWQRFWAFGASALYSSDSPLPSESAHSSYKITSESPELISATVDTHSGRL